MGERERAAADDGSAENRRLTREEVRKMRPAPESSAEGEGEEKEHRTVFEDLLTPRTRAAILDVLVAARGEALTVSQMTRENPSVSTSSFERHRGDLLDYGVMEKAGKVGNAMTYRLNTAHPAAQLLAMLDNILVYGETPLMLDDYFVSEADYPLEEDVE